jgi:hypothetical protein
MSRDREIHEQRRLEGDRRPRDREREREREEKEKGSR